MFRTNTVPILLATVCGVLTAVTTFQPELRKQKDERLGEVTFPRPSVAEHQAADNAISQAISRDLKAAADEVKAGGFAWGIRKALFGDGKDSKNAEIANGRDTSKDK